MGEGGGAMKRVGDESRSGPVRHGREGGAAATGPGAAALATGSPAPGAPAPAPAPAPPAAPTEGEAGSPSVPAQSSGYIAATLSLGSKCWLWTTGSLTRRLKYLHMQRRVVQGGWGWGGGGREGGWDTHRVRHSTAPSQNSRRCVCGSAATVRVSKTKASVPPKQ